MQNLFFNLVVLTLIISHYTLQAQTNNPQPAPDIVYCTPRPFNGVDPLTLIPQWTTQATTIVEGRVISSKPFRMKTEPNGCILRYDLISVEVYKTFKGQARDTIEFMHQRGWICFDEGEPIIAETEYNAGYTDNEFAIFFFTPETQPHPVANPAKILKLSQILAYNMTLEEWESKSKPLQDSHTDKFYPPIVNTTQQLYIERKEVKCKKKVR
ncbi:MAG: hypothetical protein IPI59_16260 [Sphingobacteriales bacterium]|jgi:hypothetical protein|nr:hypothetical protein [Sphingobacteriales bacterium]MBK7529037.1 hypothetical protein [Sphingobacteriales bacterium]